MLRNKSTLKIVGLAAIIIIVAIGGIYLMGLTKAATPFVSIEPESGAYKGSSSSVSDTAASSGKAVKFSAPAPSTSPSGEAMPVGNLTGWTQVFTDDFTSGNVAIGSFPGSYSAKWDSNYRDGIPDTAGNGNGGLSGYYPSKVLSIQNGVMDFYLHSEGGKFMGAAPAPKLTSSWPFSSMTYGRISVRYKSDVLPGYKTAWLLWPDSGIWPNDGEIDFPEGDLGKGITGANHRVDQSNDQFDVFRPAINSNIWHTATFEWTQGKVQFFIDGVSIGTTTTKIPYKPMHYILQTESCLPSCPSTSTAGHLQLDWISIWKKS